MRKDDFIEFDYTVLLHEIPTQVRKCVWATPPVSRR